MWTSTFNLPAKIKGTNKNTNPYFKHHKTELVTAQRPNLAVVVGHKNLVVIDIDKNVDKCFLWVQSKLPSVEKSYIVRTGKGYHIYLRLTDKAFALISKKATHHIFYPDKKLADKKIKLDSVKTEEMTVDSKSKKIVVDDRIGLEGLKSQELLKSDGYVVGYKVGELKVCRGNMTINRNTFSEVLFCRTITIIIGTR